MADVGFYIRSTSEVPKSTWTPVLWFRCNATNPLRQVFTLYSWEGASSGIGTLAAATGFNEPPPTGNFEPATVTSIGGGPPAIVAFQWTGAGDGLVIDAALPADRAAVFHRPGTSRLDTVDRFPFQIAHGTGLTIYLKNPPGGKRACVIIQGFLDELD